MFREEAPDDGSPCRWRVARPPDELAVVNPPTSARRCASRRAVDPPGGYRGSGAHGRYENGRARHVRYPCLCGTRHYQEERTCRLHLWRRRTFSCAASRMLARTGCSGGRPLACSIGAMVCCLRGFCAAPLARCRPVRRWTYGHVGAPEAYGVGSTSVAWCVATPRSRGW
jgi:hypothetical protein